MEAVKESELLKALMLKGSSFGLKLFRTNAGVGFRDGRPIRSLPVGFPDLFGWVSYKNVAFVVAVEVKTKNTKVSEQQERFRKAFEKDGGVYFLCRSVDDLSFEPIKTKIDKMLMQNFSVCQN